MTSSSTYRYKVTAHYCKCKDIVKQVNIKALVPLLAQLYQFNFIVQIQGETSDSRKLFFLIYEEDLNCVT